MNKSHVLTNCQQVSSSMMSLYVHARSQIKQEILPYYTYCGKKRILAASFIVHDRSVLKRALVESTHCLIHWITSALLAARDQNETAWTTFLHQKRLSGSLTSTFCENVCDNRNLFAVFITYKIKSMISYCYLSNMKDNLFYTLIMQYDNLCIWSRCNFCFVFLQIKKISRI